RSIPSVRPPGSGGSRASASSCSAPKTACSSRSGVVTGMAAAHPPRSLIIVAGLAEAVAGAISMGGGSYLASHAEEQLDVSESAAEGREIDEFPEREKPELAIVLEREGLDRQQAERVARGLASPLNVC